jgi:S1-C subfamily serine protease
MVNIRIIILIVFSVVYSGGYVCAEFTTSQIVKKYSSSVVAIITFDKNDQSITLGSGFFINKEGAIVTNHHVLEGCTKAIIKTEDGKKGDILEIINDDPELDLLIAETSLKSTTPLPLGDSETITIGEEIVAIGNPAGLEGTVSNGIISGVREVKDIKVLQITASTSQGSSGGPVFDTGGKVIGIATATLDIGQNLNFAMPINYIKTLKPCKIRLGSLPKTASVFGNVEKDKGNLYRNAEYKFRIKFPNGWEIVNGDSKNALKKAVNTKDGVSIVVVAVKFPDTNLDTKNFSEKEIDEFLNDSIDEIKQKYTDVKVIEKGIRYLDNKKAVYFKYSFIGKTLDETHNLMMIQYATFHKGIFYSIGGGTQVDKFSSQEGIISKSISSFVLEEDTHDIENNLTNDFAVYQDDMNKFIFQYPKTWLPVSTTHKGTKIKVVNKNGFGDCDCGVNVQYDESVKKTPLAEFIASISKEDMEVVLRSTISDATVIESGKTYLSNQEAFYTISRFTFRSFGIEVPMKMLLIQTLKNGYIYTVACRTSQERFDEMFPSFQAIIAGFLIKE